MARHALHDPQWIVLPQSRTSLLDALTFDESQPGMQYSLTDYVSIRLL
jgi:hypothetical protein